MELTPHIKATEEVARQAFRTKALLNESKKSNLISKKQLNKDYYNHQLHRIYPLYTWIIDIVYFYKNASNKDSEEEKPPRSSYLLCVEANSRYAVIYHCYRESNRVVGELRKLIANNNVNKILGDNDTVFISKNVKEFCDDNNIEYDFRKSEDTSHTHTAILDRVVRTFRDMLYNLKVKDPNPLDMKAIADIYNKTRHETLSRVLDQPITPEGMHRNESIQLLFIRRLKGINWSKMQKKSYQIPEGRKVFVRNEYKLFEKKRGIVENEDYYVVSHQGALYRVKNRQGEEKVVPRRDLRANNITS